MLFPCYKQRWEVAYNILESMLSEAGCNGQRGELDVRGHRMLFGCNMQRWEVAYNS